MKPRKLYIGLTVSHPSHVPRLGMRSLKSSEMASSCPSWAS